MDQKDLAAMLTTTELVGVASEVNLTNSYHKDKKKQLSKGSTMALIADVTRSLKEGYQLPHKKELCPPKYFSKSLLWKHSIVKYFNLSWNTIILRVLYLKWKFEV